MARRKKKPEAEAPAIVHDRFCHCKGTGVLPGQDFTHANGVRYTKVAQRCPGKHAPLPPQAPPPDFDAQSRAAGEFPAPKEFDPNEYRTQPDTEKGSDA